MPRGKFSRYLRASIFTTIIAAMVFVGGSRICQSLLASAASAPVANNDTVTAYDYPVLIDPTTLMANDENADGMSVHVTSSIGGPATLDGDGMIEYYPNLSDPDAPMGFSYTLVPSGATNGELGDGLYYFDGHYYKLIDTTQMSWSDANASASSMTVSIQNGAELSGGHLVEINSAEEDDFLAENINTTFWTNGRMGYPPNYWFWMSSTPAPDNAFWINGSPANDMYSNWGDNEPGDYVDDRCLAVESTGTKSIWGESDCDVTKYYLVEFDAVEATVEVEFGTGNMSCTIDGVTARWAGSIADVGCMYGYIIRNNNAAEITLSGIATEIIHFSSHFADFTTLNLDNLTENNPLEELDCNDGMGCIFLDDITSTSKLDINLIGDNLLRDIYVFVDELTLSGPGSLNALYVANGKSGNTLNTNTDIHMFETPIYFGPILGANSGTLNILGGSVIINGESEGLFTEHLVYANDISISNGASIIIALDNPTAAPLYALYFENLLTLGDKVVVARDGVTISNPSDPQSYLVEADSSTTITFGGTLKTLANATTGVSVTSGGLPFTSDYSLVVVPTTLSDYDYLVESDGEFLAAYRIEIHRITSQGTEVLGGTDFADFAPLTISLPLGDFAGYSGLRIGYLDGERVDFGAITNQQIKDGALLASVDHLSDYALFAKTADVPNAGLFGSSILSGTAARSGLIASSVSGAIIAGIWLISRRNKEHKS